MSFINALYSSSAIPFKTFQNASIGANIVNKAAQLVADLESINARANPAQTQDTETENSLLLGASDQLNERIEQSIKDIIEIRRSLNINLTDDKHEQQLRTLLSPRTSAINVFS